MPRHTNTTAPRPRTHFVTVSISTDVDVDLAEVDTDELLDEVKARGVDGAASPAMDGDEFMDRARALLHRGDEAGALALLRAQVNDVFGTAL